MMDKAFLIVLGWALCSTAMSCFFGWLLFKKQSTTNKIANLKQKTKRNKDSTIENDITPTVNVEAVQKRIKQPKEGLLSRLKEKRQLKKEQKGKL